MRKRRFTRHLIFAVVLAMMLAFTTLSASAVAVTGVSGVEVTCDTNGSISESGGTVTVKAAGSFTTRKTTVITVSNTSGSTATISFNVSTSNIDAGESTIDDLGGTFSQNLTAGQSVTYKLCSTRFSITDNTGVATLSDFKVEVATTKYDVELSYDTNNGSVTIDGVAASPGTHQIASAVLEASAKNGAVFLGWINPDTNAVLSTASSYPLVAKSAEKLRAVFANASAAPMFWADGTAKLFESLDAALSYASSASNKTITLASDGTLPAGNYTIPASVTLLIPCDDANAVYATSPGNDGEKTYTTPTAYRTLTMASGANITVNGAICVAGKIGTAMNNSQNGAPSGPLGFIKMASDSKITVNSDANLYAWGYITGSGSVEIMNGGTVYEDFQVRDWRGGSVTSSMVSSTNKGKKVFPLSQFYIQNIEVPLTLNAGAKEIVSTAMTITLAGVQNPCPEFIGSNGLFRINSGCLIKDYDESTGRTVCTIRGDLSISNLSITLKTGIGPSKTINSNEYVLPIPSHFSLTVESGTIAATQDIALLPGSELLISESAVITMGSGNSLYVYDADDWGNYCYFQGGNAKDSTYCPLLYAPDGVKDQSGFVKNDAKVVVNGQLDASAGGLYTTEHGANIYSTGNGQVVMGTNPSTTTYQYSQIAEDESGDGYGAEVYIDIPIASAQLKNSSEPNTITANSRDAAGIRIDNTYTYNGSKWVCETHTAVVDAAVAPTCTATGLTEGKHCSVCNEVIVAQTTVDALGHTEVIDAAVAATCTATGLTEGKHCSVCNEVIVAQTEVPALGHTEVVDAAVAATCTATGLTEGKHCSVCNAVLVAQEVVDALGHTEVVDAAKAPTCTETGLTEGKHCSVCNEVIVAQTEVPALGHAEVSHEAKAPTCTEIGWDAYVTCSRCDYTTYAEKSATGHQNTTTTTVEATCTEDGSVTVTCDDCGATVSTEAITAAGHSYETVVTEPTCEAEGYTTHTCSVCGDSYVADEVDALGHNYVNGTCSVCGAVEALEVELKAIELSLDAEVLLWLKFILPDELVNDENAKVIVTKDGAYREVVTEIGMTELRAKGTDKNGRYVIEQGVASGELGRDVTVQFVDGNGNYINIKDYVDGSVDTAITRTAVDYAKLALEKGSAKQKNMMQALLTYGGYAQSFYDVDKNEPVYGALNEFSMTALDLEKVSASSITQELVKSDTAIGIQQTTQQSFLDSAIYHRVYFVLDEGASIENYTFALTWKDVNEEEHTDSVEAVYESSKNRYYVDILDIPAAYLDYMYQISVTNTQTKEIYTVRTSVMAFAKLALEKSTNQDQINLFKALYYYNQVANEFFGK